MHDAVTVGAALQDGFVEFERVFVDFIRDGRYIKGEDVVVRASVKEMDAESFMKNLSRSIEDNNGI
jgi:inosine-uridine nucleoside N-ribohydrolase